MDTPSALSTYLGVDYDLSDPHAVTATLPEDKKERYVRHLKHYIGKAEAGGDGAEESVTVTRAELQSLVGKLAHAAYIFRAGRPFYQRLLQMLRGRGSSKRIKLDHGCVDDMRWWVQLLDGHSGSILVNPSEHEVKVFTDASTSTGYGVYMKGRYFHGEWSQEIKDLLVDFTLTINELELIALNFALETFGRELRGCRLHFRCDNLACVSNIHSMSSKRPTRAAILRRLYAVAAHYGITLCSTHIGTKLNLYADTLSRGNMIEFFSLQHFHNLQEVKSPALDAMDLLVRPCGRQNVSSPRWFVKNMLL